MDDSDLLTDGQVLWLDDVKYSAARLCWSAGLLEGRTAGVEQSNDNLLPPDKRPGASTAVAVSNAVADRYTAPFSMQLRVLTERVFVVQSEQQLHAPPAC